MINAMHVIIRAPTGVQRVTGWWHIRPSASWLTDLCAVATYVSLSLIILYYSEMRWSCCCVVVMRSSASVIPWPQKIHEPVGDYRNIVQLIVDVSVSSSDVESLMSIASARQVIRTCNWISTRCYFQQTQSNKQTDVESLRFIRAQDFNFVSVNDDSSVNCNIWMIIFCLFAANNRLDFSFKTRQHRVMHSKSSNFVDYKRCHTYNLRRYAWIHRVCYAIQFRQN